ncbi:hypothetical protein RKD18_007982 [Streptomyces phaeoluteigriseus]
MTRPRGSPDAASAEPWKCRRPPACTSRNATSSPTASTPSVVLPPATAHRPAAITVRARPQCASTSVRHFCHCRHQAWSEFRWALTVPPDGGPLSSRLGLAGREAVRGRRPGGSNRRTRRPGRPSRPTTARELGPVVRVIPASRGGPADRSRASPAACSERTGPQAAVIPRTGASRPAAVTRTGVIATVRAPGPAVPRSRPDACTERRAPPACAPPGPLLPGGPARVSSRAGRGRRSLPSPR